MKFILATFRGLLVILNTAFQISLLFIDGAIFGKSVEKSFKHRRLWARRAMKIIGVELVEQTGSIEVPTALIISNHRSLIDPVIQAAFIDAYIIAKAEVSNLPIISKGAEMTGIIFVKREKLRSRLAAREMTKDVLSSGQNVLVYAEGTTGTNRHSEKFKPGTFAVAVELGIPIIPVVIEYSSHKDYWYDKSLSKQIVRQIGVWNTSAKLHIGQPIMSDDPKALMETTKAYIDRQLEEMQEGWSSIFNEAKILEGNSDNI